MGPKASSALLLVLIEASFVQRVDTQNPCHAFCAPFFCHGPTELNCDACSGNAILEINQCICKPGWFSISGRCDTYIENCKQIEVIQGTLNCISCISMRDTLVGSNCLRSSRYFFLRPSTTTYTASTTDKNDANYFLANQCLSIGLDGKCLECYEGGIINQSGSCVYSPSLCAKRDAAGACMVAKPYYYLTRSSQASFAPCYGACFTCIDGIYGSCMSCAAHFYFKLNNDSTVLGNCYPCHPSCDSCFGPLSNDCMQSGSTHYVERSDPNNFKRVIPCPAGCIYCVSGQNCLWCASGKISVDGICSTTSITIPGCLYQYRTSSPASDTCLQYSFAYITATDHKGYSVATSLAISKCVKFGFTYTDRVTVECKTCSTNYLLSNGICFQTISAEIANCNFMVPISLTSRICLMCSPGYILSTSRNICSLSCLSNETPVHDALANAAVCSPCPDLCSRCSFADSKLKCIQCQTGYALYKDRCMSQICGDGLITLNKECDIATNPTTCSSDCLNISLPDCPSSSSCVRSIFQLKSHATNELEFSVIVRYSDKVSYTLDPNIIYDSSDPTAQKFFCRRLFPEVSDPSAVCYLNPDSQTATVTVSARMMRWFQTQPTTSINIASIQLSRKYISQLAFKSSSIISVVVSASHISKLFVITTPPVVPHNQDLVMSYELLDPSVRVTVAGYSVSSATINGVDQPQIVAVLNQQLSVPIAGAFVITSNLLSDQLKIGYFASLQFSDGSSDQIHSSLTVLIAPQGKILRNIAPKQHVDYQAPHPTELHLSILNNVFATKELRLKIDGNELEKASYNIKYYQQIRVVVVQLWTLDSSIQSEFWLECAYTDSVSEYIMFKVQSQDIAPSILVPNYLPVGEQIKLWMSVGAEYSYSTYCYSKSTAQRYFSTTSTQSNYSLMLNQTVSVPDIVDLFLVVSKTNLSRIYAFDLEFHDASLATGFTPGSWEIPASAMYFDGSSKHLSSSEIVWGFGRQNAVAALQSPTVVNCELWTQNGKKMVNLGLRNVGNKIMTTTLLPGTSAKVSVELTLGYFTQTGLSRALRSLSSIISPTVATLSSTALLHSNQPEFWFDINLITSSTLSIPDPLQHTQILFVPYQDTTVSPLMLPTTLRYLLYLHPYLGPTITFTSYFYDYQRYYRSATTSLALGNSIDAEPFLLWMQIKLTSLASLSESPLPSMALLTYHLNRAVEKCRSLSAQCPSTTPASLSLLRWQLFASFKSFWGSITDKYAFQNWETSLLKSVVLNGLTTDGLAARDADIDWVSIETQRETQELISQVQTQRSMYGRFTYELVETLKPLLTLTLFNLDQHTSAVTHALQLYVQNYQSFTSADQCSVALNTLYKHLLGLNEVRLIRYTQVSDPSFYQNEVVIVAGLTLTEPLSGSTIIWAGDKVAVEVKNLHFGPVLDSYEMSVVVFRDSFFDSLNTLLQKFNLSSTLEQSRTSVSFTNSFDLVYPKVQNDTEINIYRPLEQCKGTPCNPKVELVSGQVTTILCECLTQSSGVLAKKPTPSDPSDSSPFKNVTKQVGEVLKGMNNQTAAGINCLFGEPQKCVQNKRIWLNSIMSIFVLMSIMSIIACALDSNLITPRALIFFSKSRVLFSVDNLLNQQQNNKELIPKISIAEEAIIQRQPNIGTGSATTSSSESGPRDSAWEFLSTEEKAIVERFLCAVPSKINPPCILKGLVFKKYRIHEKLVLVASLTHPISAILTSQSKAQSRKSVIFLYYLRCVYELALSMFFTAGLASHQLNYYMKFILRCMFSTTVVSILIPIMKKTISQDNLFGMSAVGCIPKLFGIKLEEKNQNTPSSQPLTGAAIGVRSIRVPLKERHKIRSQYSGVSRGGLRRVSPAGSALTINLPQSNQSGRLDSWVGVSASSEIIPSIPENPISMPIEAPGTPPRSTELLKKLPKLLIIFFGYSLMYGFLVTCIMVIVAISHNNDQSGNWPWGYWYLLQFIISCSIGSVPAILLQWGLLQLRMMNLNLQRTQPQVKIPFLARRNFLFNNDVFELTALIDIQQEATAPAQEKFLGSTA